jgi:hypothetical protein
MERLRPCGDLGGASAQLALNLLGIVTAVVATLSLQRAFFRRQRRLSERSSRR